jgi:hypothetical protein
MMEAALKYADMGLRVIPLHGKRPYFENWTEVATSQPEKIEKWWSQEPGANVGIATGRSSGVFVLDVDPKSGGDESLDTLIAKHGKLPDTWAQITGSGGRHLFFRYPTGHVGNKVGFLPGLDIRGDGGQVVASPSVHPDTHHRYIWDGTLMPWEEPVAEAPLWLLDVAVTQQHDSRFERVPLKIPKGVQHATLVALAGKMRNMGLTEDEIFPSLLRVNVSRCEVPGPEKNVRQIAHSMMRYEPGSLHIVRAANSLEDEIRRVEALGREVDAARADARADGEQRMDGLSLFRAAAQDPTVIIPPILYEGLTLIAGRPKIGKSWLTLQLALATSTGAGRFLGDMPVETPGRVVYLALEEAPRRTSGRLKKLTEDAPELQHIEFFYEVPSANAGGWAWLKNCLQQIRPTICIIDTFMGFMTGERGEIRRDPMGDDYAAMARFQKGSKQFNTAVVLVHHMSKNQSEDPLDRVAGTTGITAAADCIWTVVKQPRHRMILTTVGREIESQSLLCELKLKEGLGWVKLASGTEEAISPGRIELLDEFREAVKSGAGPGVAVADLVERTGKTASTVKSLLHRMERDGQIIKLARGLYCVAN